MYFVVDLEATCWEKLNFRDRNEIIEIGLVVCNVKGEVTGKFQSFVRPTYSPLLSEFCKNLTNIKQECVDDADSLNIVIPRLKNWVLSEYKIETSNIVWTSFGDWDESCLKRDCQRHRVKYPFGRFINLKELYVKHSGQENDGLIDAVKRNGLEVEGQAHRAIYDAINAAKLARFLIIPEVLSK